MKSPALIKFARLSLPVYAVVLTALVILAATVGPFQESYRLWSQVRVLQSGYKESEGARKKLEEERTRLLATLRNVQANWTAQQATIRALRQAVNNPEVEQRLVESNRLVEKLIQERAVLIAKLNALRQAAQPPPPEQAGP